MTERFPHGAGQLALDAGYRLPVKVCQSANGYYLGTSDKDGPVSRESVEYFPTFDAASLALETKEWNQREQP